MRTVLPGGNRSAYVLNMTPGTRALEIVCTGTLRESHRAIVLALVSLSDDDDRGLVITNPPARKSASAPVFERAQRERAKLLGRPYSTRRFGPNRTVVLGSELDEGEGETFRARTLLDVPCTWVRRTRPPVPCSVHVQRRSEDLIALIHKYGVRGRVVRVNLDVDGL